MTRAGHLADLVFFRCLATAMIVHEVAVVEHAESGIIIGAICLFFMPDWLRGKNSLALRALLAVAGKR